METVMTAAARRWSRRDAHRFAQLSPPRHHRGQRLNTVHHSRSRSSAESPPPPPLPLVTLIFLRDGTTVTWCCFRALLAPSSQTTSRMVVVLVRRAIY